MSMFDVNVKYHETEDGEIKVDSATAPTVGELIEALGEDGYDEYTRGECTVLLGNDDVQFFSPMFGQFALTNVAPGPKNVFGVVMGVISFGQARLSELLGYKVTATFKKTKEKKN